MHHRPVFISATGQTVSFLFLRLKKSGAERIGKRPLSRPPASQAGIPHTVRKSTAHGQWLSWSERRSRQL